MMDSLTIDVPAGEISIHWPEGMEIGEALELLAKFCADAEAELKAEASSLPTSEGAPVLSKSLPELDFEGDPIPPDTRVKSTMRVHLCAPAQPSGAGHGCPFHVDLRCCHLNAPDDLADYDALFEHLNKKPPEACPLRAHSVIVEVG